MKWSLCGIFAMVSVIPLATSILYMLWTSLFLNVECARYSSGSFGYEWNRNIFDSKHKYFTYELSPTIDSSSTFENTANAIIVFAHGQRGDYTQSKFIFNNLFQSNYESGSIDNSQTTFTKFYFYSMDFNGELSAFDGQCLSNQAEYLASVLDKLSTLKPNIPIAIIGHSMGGVVAHMAVLLSKSNLPAVIITLGSPIRDPLSFMDPTMIEFYNNYHSRSKQKSTFVFSLATGSNDLLVLPEYTCLYHGNDICRNVYACSCNHLPSLSAKNLDHNDLISNLHVISYVKDIIKNFVISFLNDDIEFPNTDLIQRYAKNHETKSLNNHQHKDLVPRLRAQLPYRLLIPFLMLVASISYSKITDSIVVSKDSNPFFMLFQSQAIVFILYLLLLCVYGLQNKTESIYMCIWIFLSFIINNIIICFHYVIVSLIKIIIYIFQATKFEIEWIEYMNSTKIPVNSIMQYCILGLLIICSFVLHSPIGIVMIYAMQLIAFPFCNDTIKHVLLIICTSYSLLLSLPLIWSIMHVGFRYTLSMSGYHRPSIMIFLSIAFLSSAKNLSLMDYIPSEYREHLKTIIYSGSFISSFAIIIYPYYLNIVHLYPLSFTCLITMILLLK